MDKNSQERAVRGRKMLKVFEPFIPVCVGFGPVWMIIFLPLNIHGTFNLCYYAIACLGALALSLGLVNVFIKQGEMEGRIKTLEKLVEGKKRLGAEEIK
ncbi:MAG: hypothetical protein WCI27_05210 [Candidatus Omnitrophota bacterium]